MVTIDDVRRIALSLPRAYEALVGDRVKFRVGRIVFLSVSADETLLGFGFPKDERLAMIEAEPHKFVMPRKGDLRYNWLVLRMEAVDEPELRELIIDAWRMCVPKKVRDSYLTNNP